MPFCVYPERDSKYLSEQKLFGTKTALKY